MKDPDPGTLNNQKPPWIPYPDSTGLNLVAQAGTDNICDYSFYNIRGFHVPWGQISSRRNRGSAGQPGIPLIQCWSKVFGNPTRKMAEQ